MPSGRYGVGGTQILGSRQGKRRRRKRQIRQTFCFCSFFSLLSFFLLLFWASDEPGDRRILLNFMVIDVWRGA